MYYPNSNIMKNKIAMFILLAAGLTLGACKKELQQTNVNPNALEHPDPTSLLSNMIVNEFYTNVSNVWTLGNGYDQYMTFSSSIYSPATRYLPQGNDVYWNNMYADARDANTLIQLAQTGNNPLQQAAALILRSYAFASVTELWGDVPCTQALQGINKVYTPKFDAQQVVYTDPQVGILPSLKRADSLLQLDVSHTTLPGDVLFGGKPALWRSFANALRVRYLVRISSKMDPTAELQSIMSENALMQNTTQSAVLTLPTTLPYDFVSLTERAGDFGTKYMDTTLYIAYKATADTVRMSTYFAPATSAPAGAPFSFSSYGGMRMVDNANGTQSANSSLFNSSFQTGTNPALIKARVMTYAEQQFALAEAALKGYITTGTAQSYYESGVLAAYAEINLSAAQGSAYLSHAGVAYDAANALSQIITQKWLLNINNGFEGWIEYRRTGFPVFDNGGKFNQNGGLIPTRFLYPVTEQKVNSTNYNAELTVMGGKETTNYKAWWEK